MSPGVATDKKARYVPIPVMGVASREPLQFPVYLRTSVETWVLYRDKDTRFDEAQLERLQSEGVEELFIRIEDRAAYLRRMERGLDSLLQDRSVAIERRTETLHGVAVTVASEILGRSVDRSGIERAQRLLVSASGLVLREQQAFRALRSLLGASDGLAQHSVTASFLAMGLARSFVSAEPQVLVTAGLAGMLHDVGRIGYEDLDHDPEHVQRGVDLLARLGLPEEVREAVLSHHERFDGSGFPRALSQHQLPILGQIVGLVDVFDKIYAAQGRHSSIFESIRLMAEAYSGCFQPHLVVAFVKMFQ